MTATSTRLASQFARNILDHERRNDLGGTYHQNRNDFEECVFYFPARGGNKMYALPNGRRTKDFSRAVQAWATEER